MNKEFARQLLLNNPGRIKIRNKSFEEGYYLVSTENHKILDTNGELYYISEAEDSGWEMF